MQRDLFWFLIEHLLRLNPTWNSGEEEESKQNLGKDLSFNLPFTNGCIIGWRGGGGGGVDLQMRGAGVGVIHSNLILVPQKILNKTSNF